MAQKRKKEAKEMRFIDIQNEVVEKYRIVLCDGSMCKDDWRRTHAHPKERKVCKWQQVNSVESTFTLLHEIGHIENNNSKMRRCEQEYHATAWAIVIMKQYGIVDKISDKTKKLYQDYILRERDRGVKRGGAGYPTKEQMVLEW